MEVEQDQDQDQASQAEVCRIQEEVLAMEGKDVAYAEVVHAGDVEDHHNTKDQLGESEVLHCVGKGQEGHCCACKAVRYWVGA